MPVMKLTKRNIDTIKPPKDKPLEDYRDPQVKGWCLRAYKSGRKQFTFRYQMDGKRRVMNIGDYGTITPDQAKAVAEKLRADVAKGIDPQDERDEQRKMPTFAAWVDEYLAGAKLRKKSVRDDMRYLGMATERFGNKKLDKVTRTDVKNRMDSLVKVGKTNATANRFHASVRSCLAEAVLAGLVPTNVAAGIKHYPEPLPRDRTLTDDEMRRLIDALDGLDNLFAKTAIYMLIETGARKSEALAAKWDDIRFEDELWRLPDTKAGKPQVVPLSKSILARLRLLPRTDSPYLFPGDGKSGHIVDLKKPWAKVRKAAGIPDVRMHDVRRTFGLHIARTAGLHMASKLLRHSSIKVTELHYAPLGLDEMRAALDKSEAEIVPITKGKVA